MKLTIKFLMIALTVVFLAIGNVHALHLEYDQSKNIMDYKTTPLGNRDTFAIAGNTNNPNYLGYDFRKDYDLLNYPIYILLENGIPNTPIKIGYMYNDPLTHNSTFITQTFNLTETGMYYFKLVPDAQTERATIYINITNNSDVLVGYTINEYPVTFPVLLSSLFSKFMSLLDINLALWKLAFYMIVLGIIVGIIGLLIRFAWKIYKDMDKVGREKRKLRGD